MSGFDRATLDAAEREREVQLTTYDRETGKPKMVTIWITADGGRLFVRAGRGPGGVWPRNLMAHGRGVLRLAGTDLPVRPRHVTDPAEARAVAAVVLQKYGPFFPHSAEGEPLTPVEQATFELLPVDAAGAG